MNRLYFGDNLDVLREYVPAESIDLIYLDPPFNSQVRYNVLFHTPEADAESAQVEAFKDTWTWTAETTVTLATIMRAGGEVARLLDALRGVFGESDMMAYLVMMAVRLVELRRVLKPNGSIYLHCDPTAGHYLKILMDSIFGGGAFVNHVTWKRSHAHSDSAQGSKHFGRVSDFILFYSASPERAWNVQHTPYAPEYVDRDYRRVELDTGRRFRLDNIQGPGGAAKGNPFYEVMGVSRYWRFSRARMEKMIAEGLIVQTRAGAVPQMKRYLDEMPGVPLQEMWTDIPIINNRSKESLGYPTQKPVALLERIVRASSNVGDVVLDPFCGCGTTIEAAERLGRTWVGIDVAIHAVKVIEARLADRAKDATFKLEGMPRDFESAVRLAEADRYQFQWWANYLFNPHALREQKKGADRGIDGELFFPNGPGRPWGRMLTSVKSGHTNPNDVRAFAQVLDREGAQMGLFICLRSPTREMQRAADVTGLAAVVHGDLPRLQIVAIEDFFKGERPTLPPLEHLPSAAFAGRRRPARAPEGVQPELPFSFVGGREDGGVVRHFNPAMVRAG